MLFFLSLFCLILNLVYLLLFSSPMFLLLFCFAKKVTKKGDPALPCFLKMD